MKRRDTPLWTAPELVAAVQGRVAAQPPHPAFGVSIDSRSLEPGDIFIALHGPHQDGHAHVAKALTSGAAACVVSRIPEDLHGDARLVIVEDTQRGLEDLGAAARARTAARIAAVTGSVGKTSTKEMLALALSCQAATHWSVGSYNNLWGVPLSLARMPRDTSYGIFEIGMNHAGEITPLTRQVRPDVAIITNVEAVHLEFFSGVEAIADAKAEIFQGVAAGGTAVLNRDNAQFERLEAAARTASVETIRTFGQDAQAYARLMQVDLKSDSSEIEARIGHHHLVYRLNQPGLHLVMNSLAVLAAVDALGADMALAAENLERFGGVTGRGKRVAIAVAGGTAMLIDESYNASPASVRAALAVLARTKPDKGRRIAVLGDMRELGASAILLHQALLQPIFEAEIDMVFACGPLMRALYDSLPAARRGLWTETAAALAAPLAASLEPGDVVMVKGSLGSKMADIVTPLIAGGGAAWDKK
jgi:UDP-N-acetylmuramoyl-tripeptide--D-alanyl-D-alanine ligase